MKDLILIGAGGHCLSCIDIISEENKFHIFGICDDSKFGDKVLNWRVNIKEESLSDFTNNSYSFFIAIGQVKAPDIRIRLFNKLSNLGAQFAVLASPTAHISRFAKVGEGTAIFHNVILNTNVSIGKNCIINTSSTIEHDCKVGNHCHIAPGAVVNGGVNIEDGVFIGSRACIFQGLTIPSGTIVPAGTVLRKQEELLALKRNILS